MNKDKLLKKYILLFSVQTICICTYWFLFLIRTTINLEIIYLPVIVATALFISIWIEKNSLAVMSQLISRHDTAKKLNRQIAILSAIIIVLRIASGFIMIKVHSMLGKLFSSFIWLFVNLIRLTQRKIEYIRNNSEGLN